MAFELIKGSVVYVQDVATTEGYWHNGQYFKGEEATTYRAIPSCTVEPLTPEESELLPTGIKTYDTRWLYTAERLRTFRESNEDASRADVVYLSNPEEGRARPQAYTVLHSEFWDGGDDFVFIDEEHSYIIVKEGKL
ncbi:head-closure protein [Vibrio phage 1.121.O._10N.286.46.C4]|nr:head-closure protein [Vibrio phage 1.121.O._10N.286.46.C4]